MDESSFSAQRSLRRLGTVAKKKLGQNFLENKQDLEAIASSLGLQKGEAVLEIGPGLGALTEELLKTGAQVVAIEKDRHMATHLRQTWPVDQLRIIEGDVLEVGIPEICGSQRRIKVAGNIPYNITSPIVFRIIDQAEFVSEAVLTVQKEVAERICAQPGGRIWGALSVMVQSQAHVQVIRKIPRSHFYPSPNVDSAVIHLKLMQQPVFGAGNREAFSFWVAKAFQKRRKMLLNALESDDFGWDKDKLAQALSHLGIDAKRRPETLTVLEWSALVSRLGQPRQS